MFGVSARRGGCVAGRLVVGDLRVQEVLLGDGRRAVTILTADGTVHPGAERFLRSCSGGTDRTYAYLLVDHLRWLKFEGLTSDAIRLRDLRRYMAAVGAEFTGPYGRAWHVGRRPYGQSSLETAAACLKAFYLHQGSHGV